MGTKDRKFNKILTHVAKSQIFSLTFGVIK